MATLSYAAVCRGLSKQRLAAYSLESDTDSVDAVARYQWNMALAAAVAPVLHLVEVAFRNALYNTGVDTTAGRFRATASVPCWLDATPSFLERFEQKDVADAVRRLGPKRRQTPGHLVGQLGFGFWVRLCNRPYDHGRHAGPRLWPTALRCFPDCPRKLQFRADIGAAVGAIRDFRNLVAHHQPIWDRNPVEAHEKAVEFLGWMNPSLAAVAQEHSTVGTVYGDGPAAFRDSAERVLHF